MRRATVAALAPLVVALWCGPVASAQAAGALPAGGHFVAGTGSISGSATALTINQTSASGRGVINWNSFSIGNGNTVRFNNGSGATLNRVTGGDPSSLLGTLSATGSVYLINPQGVLVGPGGVISTGGRFVGSTLDACNATFMQGGPLMLAGTSNASVINLGRIGSSGGDVFLVARNAVINRGIVDTPNGTAELAVGRQVLLQDSSGSRQVLVQTGSGGEIVNNGTIRAAQVNLEAADGNVYALAGNHDVIRATGTSTRDGHVWLVAGTGSVRQSGIIRATDADRTGGTVDTIAQTVSFGRGQSGNPGVVAGQWNLSTPGFTVDGAASGAFSRSLNAGTSINLETTGANGVSGDLGVASDIRWQGPASLTLAAYHTLTIAPHTTLGNKGSGDLTLRGDASALDNGGSVVNHGVIDWSGSSGTVSALYDMTGSFTPGTLRSNAAWTAAPYSGLLTQVTAYRLVNSLTDLKYVANDLAGNYALGKDIDASATSDLSYTALGNINTPFSGQFDGRGHTVSSLTLLQTVPGDTGEQGPILQAQGMFGVIGSRGVVRDLSVSGNSAGTGGFDVQYATYGILAGVNYGTVLGAHASGGLGSDNIANDSVFGGLVGMNYGTISRSSSSVGISEQWTFGGLVGYNFGSGVIVQSYASGDVSAYGYTGGGGGLVGGNDGLITQSYATGSVSYGLSYCRGGSGCGGGGLVWSNGGTISQSFATGAVLQDIVFSEYVPPAGIAAFNSAPIANDVYWNKETTRATVGVFSGPGVPATNGLTTAQMSTVSSFVSYDFSPTGVWAIPPGATHPVLRWQLAG